MKGVRVGMKGVRVWDEGKKWCSDVCSIKLYHITNEEASTLNVLSGWQILISSLKLLFLSQRSSTVFAMETASI